MTIKKRWSNIKLASLNCLLHVEFRANNLQFFSLCLITERVFPKQVAKSIHLGSGLHNLFHPTIRDGSTWRKFGAHGEHGDDEDICWCLNKDIHCMFVEGKSRTVFFLQTLLFTAFLATAQKIITYALVSTWHEVSSGWEHVPRLM